MHIEQLTTELQRIESTVEDPEQQGYEAATLLCQVNGISPGGLLLYILQNPNVECHDNIMRDQGAIRWCREQMQ